MLDEKLAGLIADLKRWDRFAFGGNQSFRDGVARMKEEMVTRLTALAALPSGAEPVAWWWMHDGQWTATSVKMHADAWATTGTEVHPLFASPQSSSQVTEEMVEAAAEVFYNDYHGRYGGPWQHRDPNEVIVAQAKATAHAALTAALSPVKGDGQ